MNFSLDNRYQNMKVLPLIPQQESCPGKCEMWTRLSAQTGSMKCFNNKFLETI